MIKYNENFKEKIYKICEDNDVIFMAIFGSFVRGEQTKKSDIDIAIKYKEDSKKSLLDLIYLEFKFKKIFKRKVDLGIFDTISPYIIENVKKEMQIIYEK